MIFTERAIKISNDVCNIDEPIVLYRGDYNVEVRFTIINCPYKYTAKNSTNIIEAVDASYGQLVIKVPNDGSPIFSDVVETNEGSVVFTLSREMIDESVEVGDYTFQIRLFDANKESRATIPPVENGISIREPIAFEDVTTTNEVGEATVGYALTTAATSEDAFDSQGNYNKTTWGTGDRITAAKLNKIEAGIDGVNKKVASGGTGGEVDLSGYVTKEVGNANQITFADGQSFQAKLDAGILKGDKGDKGEKGADGVTTSIVVNGNTYTHVDGVITLPNYPTSVTGGSNNAIDILIEDAGNNFVAENVEDALSEVSSQIKDIAHLIESGNIGNNVEPEELDMPKVFFNGDKPTSKDSVYATIEYVSKTEHFKGYVDIKCQGTSSLGYPKKNYTIKMFTDETMASKLKKDFKGWGKQSKFCLKANYMDHSHARNIVSAKLWGQVVKSRSDFDSLPEELRTSPNYGAVDGFPIKVYYNNTYEGVYTWNIPKDGWMNNMDDSLDTHCILCGEEYDSGCFRRANASVWSDELHDVMPANIVTSFNNFQNFVINSSDDEFKTGLSTYADVNSLIDYYIFQYVICGLDNMGKNQLFFTYDGTKWIASSYDMDSTFGLYWNGRSFVSTEYRMQEDYESMANGNQGNLLYIRLEQLFCDEIKARYAELRANILSYSNIVREFEQFMDVIGKDLYAEDLTIYTGIPSGNTNNIQQIRNYTRDRLTYVDTQIEALTPAISCTGIVLSADTLSFTTTDTQTLEVVVSPSNTTDTIVWSVSPSGIVTVDNGVVTPIGNGECTITATCGSYSDTCNVTVSLPNVECTGISLDKNTLTIDASISTTAQLTATVTPENCTQPVVWSVSPESIVTVANGLVTAVANGEATVTATCGTQSANCAVTVSGISGSGVNPNLVFQVNSTSMNTAHNTLTDNIAGISATLTGNPTVSDNQIGFTANDKFSFDLTPLSLTTSNRTVRIKFTPTTLDSTSRNILSFGDLPTDWSSSTTVYISDSKLVMQHASNGFTDYTVGDSRGGVSTNRLSSNPTINTEHEIVITENATTNQVKWFIDGNLIQDGTTIFFDPLGLTNNEGSGRFIGNYSLIEIYNEYCDTYEDFTNLSSL